jgi:uncharacterized protein YkwD
VIAARHRGVALLFLAFALLVAPAVARAANCTPDPGWGTIDRNVAQQVAVQLNAQRAANGLGALALSPTLTASAEWKSLHMGFYGSFDHSDPAPPIARDAGTRMHDCGYASLGIGENIADGFNTPSSVMTAWMNSPGHRANILNGSFTVVGIGVGITSGGMYYWTTDFGDTADAGTVPVGTSPTPPAPAPPAPPATTIPAPPATVPPATVPTAPAPALPATTTTTPKATVPPKTTPGTATTAAAIAAPEGTSGTVTAKDAIGTPVANAGHLVAEPDMFHARPGRPRILRPLGNDQNPGAKPLRILEILHKPRGSSARVVRDGHAIRLRLPRGAHGTKHLVYLVSAASGDRAHGTITVITRPISRS